MNHDAFVGFLFCLHMNSDTTTSALQDRVRLLCIQTFFKNADGNPVSLMGAGVLSAMIMYGIGAPKMQLLLIRPDEV